MAYQSTFDDPGRDTNTFYRRTLHVLSDARVPFLVGGSHALLHYTGIVRETKDFDLFVQLADRDAALEALRLAGYWTEVTFPHWLAKARQGDDHVDLVWSSGNGICRVDDGWFRNAVEAEVLGMPVKIAPVEELLWQKSFLMERERYDGADVMHILRSCAEALDWARVMQRFDKYWPVLLMHLIGFGFVYPAERHRTPPQVIGELLSRLQADTDSPPQQDRVCRGTLLSRAQYLLDIGQYGYQDARLVPYGNMTPEDAIYWTWAIENVA
ncbi:MAG TPA: nucleotidyltransferase [Gemmatimonadaceae bacterium]|nr:nucleotidyltransferase [Gemmatimonadaceae bacterium]